MEELEDLEMWRKLKTEIEAWPHIEGQYHIRFHGEPEAFEETLECPDCHQVLHVQGVSFGPYKSGSSLGAHRSRNCPYWRNRFFRWRWQHLYRWTWLRKLIGG